MLVVQRHSFSKLATSCNDEIIFTGNKSNDTYYCWQPPFGYYDYLEPTSRSFDIDSIHRHPDSVSPGPQFNRNSASVTCLVISPNGMILVSGRKDGTICFQTHQPPRSIPCLRSLFQAGTSCRQRGCKSCDKSFGHFAVKHPRSVRSLAFSPTGGRVASGGDDGTVRIWDIGRRSQVGKAFKASGLVLAVTFAHRGKHIMALSNDRMVRIWDVATHSMLGDPLELPGAGKLYGCIRCGAFSPGGRSVVAGTKNGEVMMWNFLNFSARARVAGKQGVIGMPCFPHKATVNSVAFSPDKTMIASASSDRTVHIIDTATQELKCTFHHDRAVRDVLFIHHGARIASACGDRRIRIWDVEPWCPL